MMMPDASFRRYSASVFLQNVHCIGKTQ
jgi:hypothetical protein